MPTLTFNPVFTIGQIVYLKTDPDQQPRMVLAFHIGPGIIMYGLSAGTSESQHYDIEITAEKNTALLCGIDESLTNDHHRN